MRIGIFLGNKSGEPGTGGGTPPIDPSEITAIADFHIIGDDAVVDGSNVLTSWEERVGAANMIILGASIATTPNHTDGHRSVNLNGTSQAFRFPVTPFRSFYVVQTFFRDPADIGWRLYHTGLSNISTTDTDFWRIVFGAVNTHQIGRSAVSGGRVFNLSALELTATDTVGVKVIQAQRTIADGGMTVNGVVLTSSGFSHNQTIGDSTHTMLGVKADGDGGGAFSWMKSEILEMIGFSTETTTEQHDLVMAYLAQQYPSIN